MTATQLAKKMNTVAPAGKRLGGPGTRSKNKELYDSRKKDKKTD